MKILIAPDSFKGSLSASQVCLAFAKGIRKIFPNAEIFPVPMADGGEGTMDAILATLNGEKVYKEVYDPLFRKINAYYGLSGDKKTAIVEMAVASGLTLLKNEERNPLFTSTYGTGQLIKQALQQKVKKMLLCIGGSATNDGGAGMLQALGVKFWDKNCKEIRVCGGNLNEIAEIGWETSPLIPFYQTNAFKDIEITVACDVDNPLLGSRGAAAVFSPQKGANPETVQILEKNLKHFAELTQKTFKIFGNQENYKEQAGAGAAGGMGYGLLAYLNAKIKKGVQTVAEIIHLEDQLKKLNASEGDLVITGEGRMDEQTAYGKVPVGVAQLAKKYHLPVIAICGGISQKAEMVYESGIDSIFTIVDRPMSLEEAIDQCEILLENLGERVMRFWKAAKGIV